MQCSKCGTVLEEGVMFCPKCGAMAEIDLTFHKAPSPERECETPSEASSHQPQEQEQVMPQKKQRKLLGWF